MYIMSVLVRVVRGCFEFGIAFVLGSRPSGPFAGIAKTTKPGYIWFIEEDHGNEGYSGEIQQDRHVPFFRSFVDLFTPAVFCP
jgi:hypothetical protein